MSAGAMNAGAEIALRLGLAAGIFAAMAVWELLAPHRRAQLPRLNRWPGNVLLLVCGALVVRLLLPTALLAASALGQTSGLMPAVHFPGWAAGLAGFVALDLAIYGQHVVFHRVPWLWRLHRVHHSDRDLDVTTALRFHPLEILLSFAVKAAVIVLLGIPMAAVFVFEIVLNGCAMFNHGNVALPGAWEPWLRRVLVTPQMHEVHHVWTRADTDSNFGFNLAFWDRLFGTYRAAPTPMPGGTPVIGLPEFRDAAESRLDRLLTQPFRRSREAGGAPPPPR